MTPKKCRHNAVTRMGKDKAKIGAHLIIRARKTPNDGILPTKFAPNGKTSIHLLGMKFCDGILPCDGKYRIFIPPPHSTPCDTTPGGYSASTVTLWLRGIPPLWYRFRKFAVIAVMPSSEGSPCSNYLSLSDSHVKCRHKAIFLPQLSNQGFSVEDFQNRFPVFHDSIMTPTEFSNNFLTLCKLPMTADDSRKMTVDDGKKVTADDSRKMTANDGKYFAIASRGDLT